MKRMLWGACVTAALLTLPIDPVRTASAGQAPGQQPPTQPPSPGRSAPGEPPMQPPIQQPPDQPPIQTSPSKSEDSGISRSDRKFVTEAAEGGLTEVELGRLAAQHATSDEVKQFGQRMVDDHGKANDELKALAQQKGIEVPATISSKHKSARERLEKLQGAEFDRAYMRDMVKDHKKDVAAFEKQAKDGKDPELKAWAGKTLPTLREHLQLAEDAAAKVGAKGTGRTD